VAKSYTGCLESGADEEQLLPPGTLPDQTIYPDSADTVEQGWAWRIVPPPTPNPNGVPAIIAKNGGHPGFSTYIGFSPEEAYGLVILMNTHGINVLNDGAAIIKHTK